MYVLSWLCDAKRFKSNKMTTHPTSKSKCILHISEGFVEFYILDKTTSLTVDHSFNGFIYATCQRIRAIVGRICYQALE